jgi:retinol dehydrogenase 12
MSMKGRHVVITGANTGIGRPTAEKLAAMGARVTVLARSADKSRAVLDGIRATGSQAEFVAIDLGELASVRRAAAEVLARPGPIDVLVNNAGLGGVQGLTKDGFELHFGVNHLGHFLLTLLLLPRLLESRARVVNVSSRAHYRPKGIDYDRLRRPAPEPTGLRAYGVSKLCNVLFTRELARRYGERGLHAYAVHPGVIASDIWRTVPTPLRQIMMLFMKTTEQGAATSVYCASSPEVASDNGEYYENCKKRYPSRTAQQPELAAKLWEASVDWSGAAVPT